MADCLQNGKIPFFLGAATSAIPPVHGTFSILGCLSTGKAQVLSCRSSPANCLGIAQGFMDTCVLLSILGWTGSQCTVRSPEPEVFPWLCPVTA